MNILQHVLNFSQLELVCDMLEWVGSYPLKLLQCSVFIGYYQGGQILDLKGAINSFKLHQVITRSSFPVCNVDKSIAAQSSLS
jgi:hypothetical protein